MSFSFYVKNIPALNFKTVFERTGLSDIAFTDESQPESDNWPQGLSHIFRDRVSVRKIEADIDGRNFELRVFAWSCPEDFELAAKVTEAVARFSGRSASSDSFEQELSADEFSRLHDRKWAQDQSEYFLKFVVDKIKANFEKHGEDITEFFTAFNGTRYPIELGKEHLEPLISDQKRNTPALFDLVRRINSIDSEKDLFVSSITGMTITDKQGVKREHSYRLFTGESKVLLRNDVVCIVVNKPFANTDLGSATVLTSKFIELMGDRLEWLDRKFFIAPKMENAEFEKLLLTAKQFEASHEEQFQIVAPNSGGEEKAAASDISILERFSKPEKQALLLSPLAVFALVAAADGTIDEKELDAFLTALKHAVADKNEMLREVITGTIVIVQEHGLELITRIDPVQIIADAGAAADRGLPADIALDFRQSLLELGTTIASASGGLLSKVSKEEKQALRAIAGVLRVALN